MTFVCGECVDFVDHVEHGITNAVVNYWIEYDVLYAAECSFCGPE